MSDAIVVDRLVKRYRNVEAVSGVSFTVRSGIVFGLLGRNGAGKTTTLESCIGLVRPTSGTVRVLGLDPARRADGSQLRRRIGVQLQTTSLPEKARVAEVVELYASYYGLRPNAAPILARVGLGALGDRFVGKLSGGEQQRLALALALQHDPEVLFLDEPTAGMDAHGRRVLWDTLEQLRAEGTTIVLTTHYIEEAERLCDEICVMQAGRIVARDAPAVLVERYGGEACIDFAARGFDAGGLDELGRWERHAERMTLFVRGEPGPALARVVSRANELGVTIDALALHRPTLEDAFLALTGERIEDAAAGA